jgi:hypothetical protein
MAETTDSTHGTDGHDSVPVPGEIRRLRVVTR